MALILNNVGGGGGTKGLTGLPTRITGNSASNVDFDKIAMIKVNCTGAYSSQHATLIYDIDKNYVDGEVNGTEYPTYSGDIASGVVVDMANGTITTTGAYPQGVGSFDLWYYE